ncbi:DUF1631 family protein [Chitinibacter sp. S2-10]|uniref:DUF1631 family protein n=1 Tax=Chitinibacter sp. S2-10 TaxID=3373597 RepID=UPI003977DB6C
MDKNELLTAIRGAFLQAFNSLLPTLLGNSADALFLKADRAASLIEQRQMLDARAALMTREQGWLQALSTNMDKLLNRSFQTAYSTFRPSFSESFSLDTLSLVDADEFDGELKIDELTTRLRNVAEVQLRDLNIRMAILFDQDNINERENPFRPYLLTRCLGMAAEQLQIEPELHTLLCETLTEQLQKNVVDIYQMLNQHLARHGIAAQLQLRIRTLPDAASLRPDQAVQTPSTESTLFNEDTESAANASIPQALLEGATGARFGQWSALMRQQAEYGHASLGEIPSQAAPAGMGWLGSVKQVGGAVRQLFSGTAPIQTSPQRISPALALTIEQMNSQPAGLLDAQGEVRNLILEQRSELSSASPDMNEQMIVDIVGMLFEFILRDSQVPAEIRAQLGRMQWLVLKTALQDPALFSQKHHPARLLVNRIGSIAQGLQQLDPKAERITAEIRRIIEALLLDEDESAELFSRMLDELDHFIARELRAADEQSELASQAMENAENRTLRFARITAQTAHALSGFTLDGGLQHFLINIWPYAIEFAERNDEVQALRFRMFVPELIWSIAPKPEATDRQQLLGMIPRLIGVLNEGLKSTPWNSTQQQQFKSYMIDAHRAAITGTMNLTAPVPTMAMLRGQLAEFIGEKASDPDPAQLAESTELNPVLLDRAISELKVEIGFIDRQVEAELEQDGEPKSDADEISNAELFERLRSGVLIEVNLTGKLRQARLCWMSPTETKLILNLAADAPPSVISVNVFKRLLQSGRARWLEQTQIFERAMGSLLNTADVLDAQVV